MTRRTVIVGAGFSGTVLAAKLLREPSPAPHAITLVERSPEVGRGVAYAAREWPFLLNVPAGRMSADSNHPAQFAEFARRRLPDASAEQYLERRLYGDYLQEFLRDAERCAAGTVRLERRHGEVTGIRLAKSGPRIEVRIADDDVVAADSVILALGNPRPRELPWMSALADHPGYHSNPWTLPPRLHGNKTVLIVGNGLSMADAVLSLCDDALRIPRIVSISRRGLIPQVQSSVSASVHGQTDVTAMAGVSSARGLLKAARALARDHMRQGGDWRDVITAIRHRASSLWQRLPAHERERFVRHLQSHWDVHRHRLPPQMGSRLQALRASGRLTVHAGRVLDADVRGGRIRVTWQARSTDAEQTLQADAVVNALSPEYCIAHSRDLLVKSLRDSGMICEDTARLGIRTGPQGECLRADGQATPGIFYLGPMLRASFWEATAAPELREHAERLARHLTRLSHADGGQHA